jgi:hypothetical protein
MRATLSTFRRNISPILPAETSVKHLSRSDRADMFLRNVGLLSKGCTALYPTGIHVNSNLVKWGIWLAQSGINVIATGKISGVTEMKQVDGWRRA